MKRAKGVYCALVTPFTDNEDIDLEAAARITRRVVEGGTHGILALGSTGEQIAIGRESKKAYVKAVRKAMPSGMPLMVGCGATGTKLAIDNIHDAQEAGADSVILTPPCFYPFGDDALVAYFEQAAAASDVPVYLYNISRFVGVKIGAETVRRLLDNPKIAGIKESDRDEAYLRELLSISAGREDFAVIQGSERIFVKSFEWGCPAGVTVVGNLAPDIAPALYEAFIAGEREKAEALQQKLLDYVKVITMLGRFPQELKACMEYKGVCSRRMTSPFCDLTQEELNRLICALEELEKTI